MKRIITGNAAAAVACLAVAGGVSAARSAAMTLDCGGLGVVQVVTAVGGGKNDPWGAAQIVGGGHLIPTSFHFVAHDDALDADVYDSGVNAKGNGNANPNQPVTTCRASQTATLRELWGPGELPPGASGDDQVTLTFTVTGVAAQGAR